MPLFLITIIPIIVIGLFLRYLRTMLDRRGRLGREGFDAWFRSEYMGMEPPASTNEDLVKLERPSTAEEATNQFEAFHRASIRRN